MLHDAGHFDVRFVIKITVLALEQIQASFIGFDDDSAFQESVQHSFVFLLVAQPAWVEAAHLFTGVRPCARADALC